MAFPDDKLVLLTLAVANNEKKRLYGHLGGHFTSRPLQNVLVKNFSHLKSGAPSCTKIVDENFLSRFTKRSCEK